jgi:hypothetical protein
MHNLHSSNRQGTLDLGLIHDHLRSKFANPVALGAWQFRENDNRDPPQSAQTGWYGISPNGQTWIMGSFAKVCVRCTSEVELMEIHV